MQKLQTVNAETLLYEPLEKPSFVVDSLIPTGLSLFCGSQRIGKSWLMLKLCLCVSQGIPLWDMTTIINVNIKMYIFDHLRMYIFAILPLDRYIFLSDKIFL